MARDGRGLRGALGRAGRLLRLPICPNALAPRTQVEVLRILQEALTNVRKHADATVVRVSAERQ